MQRAGTDQHRNLAASIQHIGGTTQLCFVGQQVRHRRTDAGVHGTVRVRRRLHRGLFLQIVGQDDCRNLSVGLRDAHGAVYEMADLGRCARLLDERAGNVLEQTLEVGSCWYCPPSAARACWPTMARTG